MTTMSIEGNDFLMGQGGKAWSAEAIGDEIEGTVISAKKQQATDPKTGEPKTFNNGDPMFLYVITLQTDLRDPDNASDEGLRTVYAKGGNAATDKGTTMLVAVREAIKKAGAGGLDEGGVLKVRHTDTKKSDFPAPSKLYAAKYTPPKPSAVDVDDL